MSEDQISLFETYSVTDIGDLNPDIPDILATAVQRSYGPQLKLKLQFTICYNFEAYIDPKFVKQILQTYKDNVVLIEIPFKHGDYDFLLEPDFHFEVLEGIQLYCILDEDENAFLTKRLCESFISRYANQLEHIGVELLNIEKTTEEFTVSPLTNLKSLSLDFVDNASALGLMKSVKFDNLTELNVRGISLSSLEIKDLEIKNLSSLLYEGFEDEDTFAIAILKSNMNNLVTLNLSYIQLNGLMNVEINFSKLKVLEISDMKQGNALKLIQAARETLEELVISDINNSSAIETFSEFRFLQLKTLKFDGGSCPSITSRFVLYLINAGKETISTFYKYEDKICETMLDYLKNLSSLYNYR